MAAGGVNAQPATAGTSAPGPTASPGQPKIQFESTVYEFGKVVAGQVVRHDFIFTNTGSAPLTISAVSPSCGCTTAGSWTHEVQPGRTGIIPLQFNSSHFMGPVAKTATVICNDPNQAQTLLQIRGTIWKPIEVNPQTAILNVVTGSTSNPPALVTIVNTLDQPITLSDPESNNRAFAATLKTVRPGKEFQLAISAVPTETRGNSQGTITIRTSATNAPTVQVTAVAIVQPGLAVTPQQITLPPGPLATSYGVSVSVRNNRSEPMTLSQPVVTIDGVGVSVQELQPGHNYVVNLNFPPGFVIAEGRSVEVLMKTSDSEFPMLKVPVHQIMRPDHVGFGSPGHYRGPQPPPMPPPPSGGS